MKRHVTAKLKQGQDKLGLNFPDQLFDFISRLDKQEIKFGEEEWLLKNKIYRKTGDKLGSAGGLALALLRRQSDSPFGQTFNL